MPFGHNGLRPAGASDFPRIRVAQQHTETSGELPLRNISRLSPAVKLGLLAALVLLGYVLGMVVLAYATEGHWTTVRLSEPDREECWLLSLFVVPITWLCGWLLIGVVPGWPWVAASKRAPSGTLPFLATAIAVSIIAQIAAGSLFKAFSSGPLDRLVYTALLVTIFAAGWLWLLLRRMDAQVFPDITKRTCFRTAAGICFVILVVICFSDKLVVEDFNDDGFESFQLAASVEQYLVPTADLEIDERMHYVWTMTHPPLLPYLHLPSLLLFGPNEASVRSLYLFCYLFLVPVILSLIEQPDRRPSIWVQLVALGGLGPFVLNSMFYAGVDPNFCDFAKAGEIALTTFALVSLLMLARGHLALAVVYAVLASGIRWHGVLIMLIPLIDYGLSGPRYWKAAAGFLGILFALGALVMALGAAGGLLPLWWAQFQLEGSQFTDVGPSLLRDGGPIGLHFLLFTGFLAPAALMIPWQDRLSRSLSATTLGLLIVICLMALVTNHYFLPVVLLPTIVVCRMLEQSGRPRTIRLAAVACLGLQATAIWILVPTRTVIHTGARAVGKETCFLVDDFVEAVSLSPVIFRANVKWIFSEFSGKISNHAWVHYSTLSSAPQREFTYYVTDRPSRAPEGYELVAELPRTDPLPTSYLYGKAEGQRQFQQMNIPLKEKYYRFHFLRPIISDPRPRPPLYRKRILRPDD